MSKVSDLASLGYAGVTAAAISAAVALNSGFTLGEMQFHKGQIAKTDPYRSLSAPTWPAPCGWAGPAWSQLSPQP